jgi:hypothetical protein
MDKKLALITSKPFQFSHYAECRVLFILILVVIMLSVVMLNVGLLSVIMLSVAAPYQVIH